MQSPVNESRECEFLHDETATIDNLREQNRRRILLNMLQNLANDGQHQPLLNLIVRHTNDTSYIDFAKQSQTLNQLPLPIHTICASNEQQDQGSDLSDQEGDKATGIFALQKFSPFEVTTNCNDELRAKRNITKAVSDESLKAESEILFPSSKRACIRKPQGDNNFDSSRNVRFARLLESKPIDFRNVSEEENTDESDPLNRWIESFLDV